VTETNGHRTLPLEDAEPVPAADAEPAVAVPTTPGDAVPITEPQAEAIDLTETALEALLFVAERPLTRAEIASLAGVARATVDARLGDLEVAL
jgi:hypothetical protein